MDISLDLYKIFCIVVKTGNMSLAAKELFISQPAVSMSVRQLEDRMGSVLLIRTTKGVRPTPEGQVLYDYLEQALGLIKTAEKKYFELVNLSAGEIKLGASDSVIRNILMPYLETFNHANPKISIKVANKTNRECLKQLRNGSIDLCFVNLPIEDDSDLEIHKFLEVQDCLVGGTKYKDLAKTGLNIKDIKNYPVLILESKTTARKYIDQYATENGVDINPLIELGSNDLLLEFAKINFGLSFVIKEYTKKHIDNESLFEIKLTPEIKNRHLAIVKLKKVALSHAAKGFASLFEPHNVGYTK